MEITINTGSYNHRRYGKPWIAKVNFADNPKGNYEWGNWTGDQYNGGDGILTVDADVGDIIAEGQKDHRDPRKSAPRYYVVKADGKLDEIGDKGSAYKYYLDNHTVVNVEALQKERTALISRIAEIDNILAKETHNETL